MRSFGDKMLVKQELISKIRDYFSLNIYETKVWLALLGKGIASAGEVASISRVPRSRTYDVLESLEKKGFAIAKLGKPAKYIGIKPKIILEKLKNNIKKNSEEKILRLLNVRKSEEFAKLEEIYKGATNSIKRDNVSAALKGRSNVSNYLREMIKKTKKELIIYTDVRDIGLKLRLFQQTFENLKKAKIKVKLALSGDDNLVKQMSQRLGVKIKKADIDAKFFIVDRKEILFYLSKDNDSEDTAIWINSDFFAQAFAALFDRALK